MYLIALGMGACFTMLLIIVVQAWLSGTGDPENDRATVIFLTLFVLPFWLILIPIPYRRAAAHLLNTTTPFRQLPGAAMGACVLAICTGAAAFCVYGMTAHPGGWLAWLIAIPGVCLTTAWFSRKKLGPGAGALLGTALALLRLLIRQRWLLVLVLIALFVLGVRQIWHLLGTTWFPAYHPG